jgi:hypothetical protein
MKENSSEAVGLNMQHEPLNFRLGAIVAGSRTAAAGTERLLASYLRVIRVMRNIRVIRDVNDYSGCWDIKTIRVIQVVRASRNIKIIRVAWFPWVVRVLICLITLAQSNLVTDKKVNKNRQRRKHANKCRN